MNTYACPQMTVMDRCAPRVQQQAIQPRRSGFLSPLLLSNRSVAAFSTAEPPKPTMSEIWNKASKRALGGGIPGAGTAVLQAVPHACIRCPRK